jgi:rhamnulokinase
MAENFIAADLGASSGRVMLARLEGGRLSLAEQHRFENGPSERHGSLFWDIAKLEGEIRTGVAAASAAAGDEPAAGIGVDSWGVDYVLIGADGGPAAPSFHYRDGRTDSTYGEVCARLGRDEIFRRTGIQFMQLNTIYQLAAETDERLAGAGKFLLIADWFAHRLGGKAVQEITLASTSQLVDPRTRRWDAELVEMVRPGAGALLPELVEAGTRIGEYEGVPVFASASHDTAAAVAGCPGKGDDWAFLSSGTWSLLGLELPEPATGPEALAAGLSNELGVGGTVRLLRNIMGLWLLQECRAAWTSQGRELSWAEITALAEKAPELGAVVDPDDAPFLSPGDMPGKIRAFCERTGQKPPEGVGPTARAVLEALALKSRLVVEGLERVTARTVRTINMIGGGIQNRLLCQLTADATGRRVLAGPVEATATGNVLAQAVGAGAVSSWSEAREIVARSFELTEYEPRRSERMEEACGKLGEIMEDRE